MLNMCTIYIFDMYPFKTLYCLYTLYVLKQIDICIYIVIYTRMKLTILKITLQCYQQYTHNENNIQYSVQEAVHILFLLSLK